MPAAVLANLRGRVPARAAGPATVSIALNWFRNVEFAGIWAAQKKGWWAQAGLRVTTRPFDGTNDPTILVAAGKLQFGIHDGASVILARAAGCPIKAVWASGQRSPFAFITMPKSGITSAKDFKGRRIGFPADGRYVLDVMLHSVGLSETDVVPIVVGLDPAVLLAPWEVVAKRARAVLVQGRITESHIFNLGHGVLPETDPGVLARLTDLVHEESAR